MRSMLAESRRPFPTHPLSVSSDRFGSKKNDSSTPTMSAFTGVPKNPIKALPNPVYFVKLTTEDKAIRTMGTTMEQRKAIRWAVFCTVF